MADLAALADQRFAALHLASGIIGSHDSAGRVAAREVTARFAILAHAALRDEAWERGELVYLLIAALVFDGDPRWQRLDMLLDGELGSACKRCGAELVIGIEEEDAFVALDSGHKRRMARVPIQPATALDGVGAWLAATAARAGHADVAEQIGYLFGHSACPACREPFAVAAAIITNPEEQG